MSSPPEDSWTPTRSEHSSPPLKPSSPLIRDTPSPQESSQLPRQPSQPPDAPAGSSRTWEQVYEDEEPAVPALQPPRHTRATMDGFLSAKEKELVDIMAERKAVLNAYWEEPEAEPQPSSGVSEDEKAQPTDPAQPNAVTGDEGQDEEEEDEQEEGQPDPDAVYVDEIMDEVDALAEEKVKAFPRLPELEEEEEEEEE
ncbi:hypothetical protein C1H76_3336 [Elsinoe australis]|uniref:Uncharacterized protein n=1 Tax=Elsinoe australis TaxID=40998 RepID=A0A4U7B586_9PEZI|nr:hypothetical protein C1H76_3336 [Elsinoe australis]